ncbi:sodium-coupled neutral amino acid transporter 7-like [Amphiura filiformis]|uniref:sodium-coupled neutral amino acid transporter 7-like n=1 Tax=Amphiura filiformis TaxID=82378 RepID=UPI003B228B59
METVKGPVAGPDGLTASGNTFYVANENTSLIGSISVERDRPVGKTSLLGAIFIVVNACIGAGMLNFPAAYQGAGGIHVGILMQCALLLVVFGSLLILALCADIRLSPSYQDVITEMCGGIGKILSEIMIIIYTFGSCVAYFIVIGDQLDSILTFIHGEDFADFWYMNRKFTISIFAVFIIFPLCIPKNIDFLKYPSSVGVLASFYVCAVIVVNYHIYPPPTAEIITKPQSWMDVFSAIPAICFGFQCHVSSVPVYSSLKKRTLGEFTKVVIGALTIGFIAYTLAGVYGSLTFGWVVCSDVLLSYNADDVPVTVARCMILCNMLTTYPVLQFCGRLAIDSMWVTSWNLSSEEAERRAKPRRIIETLIWFICSLFLALFIPNIGVVISVIGGLAAVFILVFPGVCLIQFVLKHSAASIPKQRFLIAIGFIYTALGIFILGESTTQSIMKDVMNGHQQSGQC